MKSTNRLFKFLAVFAVTVFTVHFAVSCGDDDEELTPDVKVGEYVNDYKRVKQYGETQQFQTDLDAFAAAYRASFEAQITLFPAMIQPGVQEYIDQYSAMKDVLAWKMPGAGGGGYLALVVNDATTFCQEHEEAIPLYIRRPA